MANGNGGDFNPLSALPAWARALITLILQHGVSALIALFFVWFMATKLLINQEQILNEVREHRADTLLAGQSMTDFAAGQQSMQRVLVQLQLQTCLNTAETNADKQDCAKAMR